MIPLIFLHGFLGSPQDWDPVCRYLKHPYTALELPGHGKTPFTPDFNAWVPSFPKMHLVGYSMGGRLALQYAALHPAKIASLTLLSTHPGLTNENEKKERLASDLLLSQTLQQSFDDFLATWYDQPIFHGFKPDMTKRREHNPKELAKALLHFSLGKQPYFSSIKALYIVGDGDTKYKNLHPNAHLIKNAGHMVHLEEPEQIATLLRNRL